jgi:hypothetical protein
VLPARTRCLRNHCAKSVSLSEPFCPADFIAGVTIPPWQRGIGRLRRLWSFSDAIAMLPARKQP